MWESQESQVSLETLVSVRSVPLCLTFSRDGELHGVKGHIFRESHCLQREVRQASVTEQHTETALSHRNYGQKLRLKRHSLDREAGKGFVWGLPTSSSRAKCLIIGSHETPCPCHLKVRHGVCWCNFQIGAQLGPCVWVHRLSSLCFCTDTAYH